MDFPKYDGNIHPDEWINDIQNHFKIKNINDVDCLKIAISLIDPIISLPDEIDSLEKLRNALKEDISFTVFKNTNKRLLRLLKYIPEKNNVETPKFISKFRKYCYNAEINDIEEQKNYFSHLLSDNKGHYHYNYLLEFIKRKEKIKSMSDLIKEFEEIVVDEINLIKNGSIVALKHVATGKYLNSVEDLLYITGSTYQVVWFLALCRYNIYEKLISTITLTIQAFVGNQVLGPNALWKIKFDKNYDLQGGYNYNSHSIMLEHVNSCKFLGILNIDDYNVHDYYKSPITKHIEGNNLKFCLFKLGLFNIMLQKVFIIFSSKL
jgi:hypothetical protein